VTAELLIILLCVAASFRQFLSYIKFMLSWQSCMFISRIDDMALNDCSTGTTLTSCGKRTSTVDIRKCIFHRHVSGSRMSSSITGVPTLSSDSLKNSASRSWSS